MAPESVFTISRNAYSHGPESTNAEKAIGDGYRYFAPVKNTLPNVQMIGVARLRYRPHTTRTSSWFGNLYKEGPAWIQRYREWEKNTASKIA